jgi:outer membrane protein assembly complex protein YaeT
MKAKDRVTCGGAAQIRRLSRAKGNRNRDQGTAWKLASVLGTLACSLAVTAAGWAQAPVSKVLVEDVVVYGNRTIPTARIMGQIRTRPGKEYNPVELDEDVRRLVESRLVADVRVRKQEQASGRVVVQFYCTEYPNLIREIVYRNAHHLKPDELDTITGLRKGAPLNPAANRQACMNIQQRYREDGRLFASVTLEEGGQPGDSRVVFNITEGPVVRVRSVSCIGYSFVGEQRLKTQVDTSRAFLGMMGGKYNPVMIDHDVTKLIEYYRSFGFLDVRINRELKFSEDYNKVDVVFHIHEGQRYQVSKVCLEGVKALDPAYVASLSHLKEGEPYNRGTSEKDQRDIKDAYGFRGQEAIIQERVTADHQKNGFVQVHYEVVERPPARVGQVIIVGNTVTQDRVIRHEIGLFPGQILSYPELRLAERNLIRRNIFEVNGETGVRPTVTVLDNDSDCSIKDILVQIKETHTGSLMFGIGVNSDAGLVGSIVLNERNFDLFRLPTSWEDVLEGRAFRGAGQEFRIEAVPGTQLQRYTVSFREPYLFDSKFALGVSAYYYDRIFNEYTERREGGRITIDRQLSQCWTLTSGVRVENVHVGNVGFGAPPAYTSVEGDNFLVAPRIGIRRDDRDSYLRPTEGSLIDFSYEQVLGDFTFPILNLEASKFWTVWQRPDGSGRQVLAARTQVSWEGSNAPVFERFFAGGFRSMRGFEFRGVGVWQNGFNVGGDFMLLNSLEYQVPVAANDNFYLVAFVDSGTVESSVEIKDYRVSAGFGARIVVPMLGPVPIALDFGFPIVKGPGDREQVFSFWVGMFR